MRIRSAICAGVALFAASLTLLFAADEATDVAAVIAGTGLVLSGALLGLTLLAWRWRTSSGAYVRTNVDASGFYAELAAFDETGEAEFDDAAAV